MTTPAEFKGISRLRVPRPGGTDELEFIFGSSEYQELDAVFTSVDVVQRILIPHYQRVQPEVVTQIEEAIKTRSRYGMIILPHKRTCSMRFPEFDWDATSPIEL